jgi:hypothetical protein
MTVPERRKKLPWVEAAYLFFLKGKQLKKTLCALCGEYFISAGTRSAPGNLTRECRQTHQGKIIISRRPTQTKNGLFPGRRCPGKNRQPAAPVLSSSPGSRFTLAYRTCPLL